MKYRHKGRDELGRFIINNKGGYDWTHIAGKAKLNVYCGKSSSYIPLRPVNLSQKGFPYDTIPYKSRNFPLLILS